MNTMTSLHVKVCFSLSTITEPNRGLKGEAASVQPVKWSIAESFGLGLFMKKAQVSVGPESWFEEIQSLVDGLIIDFITSCDWLKRSIETRYFKQLHKAAEKLR